MTNTDTNTQTASGLTGSLVGDYWLMETHTGSQAPYHTQEHKNRLYTYPLSTSHNVGCAVLWLMTDSMGTTTGPLASSHGSHRT